MGKCRGKSAVEVLIDFSEKETFSSALKFTREGTLFIIGVRELVGEKAVGE